MEHSTFGLIVLLVSGGMGKQGHSWFSYQQHLVSRHHDFTQGQVFMSVQLLKVIIAKEGRKAVYEMKKETKKWLGP